MTILVSAQVCVRMLADPERRRCGTRSHLGGRDTEVLLSAASPWEIAVKWASVKLELPEGRRR